MEDRRLFVGNLPKDVSESALEELFKKYKVSKIYIKRKKVLDDEAVFAFINVSSEHVDKCLSELKNKKLNDCNLKVELAKESFLEKLKKEHNEKHQSNNKPVNRMPVNSYQLRQNLNGVQNKKILFNDDDFEDLTPQQQDETIESIPQKRRKITFNDNDIENSIQPINEPLEDIPRKRNLPMFRGTASIPMLDIKKEIVSPKSKSPQENINVQKSANDAYTAMKKFEEFSDVWKDESTNSNYEYRKISFKEEPKSSEKKEMKSISWRMTNTPCENFTESDADQKEVPKWKSLNQEDARFKMDEKFFDDSSIPDEKRKRKNSMSSALENKIKNNDAAKEVFEHRQLIRYDPTRPDHKVLEINACKAETSIPDLKKKKTKRKEAKHQSEPDKKSEGVKPEVSKEKHYSVADTLKDAFKKSENHSGFRLSSLFDQKLEESSSLPPRNFDSRNEVSVQNYHVENIPQQYSDDESEEDVEMESPVDIPSVTASEKVLGKCGVWGETFFFQENDSRFKEAVEFFKPNDENKVTDFDRQRSKLRSIVRKKLQNSKKDNKLFKQKLGGKLNKTKFKMRLKKASNY